MGFSKLCIAGCTLGPLGDVVMYDETTLRTGVIMHDTNPNKALLRGNPSKLQYNLHCLLPPKFGNLMIPARVRVETDSNLVKFAESQFNE